jgi:hypothetical protein
VSIEVAIRLGFFFGIFATVAVWELVAPRRALATSKTARWFRNLGITFLNPVVLRLLFPIVPVGMALVAQGRDWGLLNNVGLPYWLAIAVGVPSAEL